jgi:tripartite ATP-independent transporter DctM subunit
MMATALVISFVVFLALGVPVSFCLGASAVAAILLSNSISLEVVAQQLYGGLDSFPLMAIPFFLLAAEIMTGGAITDVLLNFALQHLGRFKGGLGLANVTSITLFSGISGSALADVAGPGAIGIRMMANAGYDRNYAAALTASTSIIGPLVPPSIIMVVYSLVDDKVSIGGLFLAGVAPALLICLAMCLTNLVISRRRNYRHETISFSVGEKLATAVRSLPAIALPILIIVGIKSGMFTATEASVFAVAYAVLIGFFVYRTLRISMLPSMLVRAALVSVSVLMLLAASQVFAWVLTVAQVPQQISPFLTRLSAVEFLLVTTIFLLFMGTFLEPLPGIIILVPILSPIAKAIGIDPLQFAVMVILNLAIGMLTPPVGSVLFVTSMVAKTKLNRLIAELWPMLAVHCCILALVTFIPMISTALPRFFGY